MHPLVNSFEEIIFFITFILGVVCALLISKLFATSDHVHFGCSMDDFENCIDPGRRCKNNYTVFKDSKFHRIMQLRIKPGETTPVHRLEDCVFACCSKNMLQQHLRFHRLNDEYMDIKCSFLGELFSVPSGVYKIENVHHVHSINDIDNINDFICQDLFVVYENQKIE